MQTMTLEPSNLNLFTAWAGILAGFGSGAWLGLGFAGTNWLGSYTSFRRRMYRLGHISFFGLGFVNLMFHLTAKTFPNPPAILLQVASWMFVIGAVSMPGCCLVMAHHPKAKPHTLFAMPVASLVTGGIVTLWILLTS